MTEVAFKTRPIGWDAAAQTVLYVGGGAGRDEVLRLLAGAGLTVSSADDVSSTLSMLEEDEFGLCVLDLDVGDEAVRVAGAIRTRFPHVALIGIANPARPEMTSLVTRVGVFDVLPRPITPSDVSALIANVLELKQLASARTTPAPIDPEMFGVVGVSPAMREVMELVRRVGPGRFCVLISGDRGTGRETIARALHASGPAPDAPFVKVDCAAPTPQDLELELFGAISRQSKRVAEHRAVERVSRQSQFFSALGGTLFLENVVEMPGGLQAKFVRVLRDGELLVVGSQEPIEANVRVIVAVEPTIKGAVGDDRLRPDLYEKLSLIRIDLPPLRERREDIPVLATHFLKELSRVHSCSIKTLTRPALTLLAALPWRGNVAELRGLLERFVVLMPQGLIKLEDILAQVRIDASLSPLGVSATLREARARFEREYIAAVLHKHHGRMPASAQTLGIQRSNLYRTIKRLRLNQP